MSLNEKPGTARHADASNRGEIGEPPAVAVTLSVWQRIATTRSLSYAGLLVSSVR